ncbi:MAG TPA: ABC transporter ATP-binding protein [Acidobacteriota bacterium]|nr:ABC transporter ATP-binding protein [Acidobacteriota bacterium]
MIRVENLTKTYGLTAAIQDVTFEVGKGEILGFLGPNGAGKTTTMRIIAGFFPATKGHAYVAGYDVLEKPLEAKRRIGYLPENPPLYSEMTVDGFLEFVARIKGVEWNQVRRRTQEVKEQCGLANHGRRLIKHLSKGYKQRVGLAQALIHEPEVLILDEPTVGLDPKQIIEVRELIKGLGGKHTVILSTHILPEVSMTCERVIIINNGRIVAVDTPENLTSQLAGGLRIEMEVTGSIDELVNQLRAMPGIRNVLAQPGVGDHYRVIVEAKGDQDLRNQLARMVVESGLELYELKRQAMTLEEIFLKLTTEEEAAA